MGSGIIFNGGPTGGGGNPFSLGVNLPAPIVLKSQGNGKTGVSAPNTIFTHGSDYVNNSNGQGALQIYFPNARYNGFNGQSGLASNIWDTINTLNPHIFLFHWKRKISGDGLGANLSHKPNRKLFKGGWTHPQHIDGGVCQALYDNYGYNGVSEYYKGYDDGAGMPLPPGNTPAINAFSEWSLNNSEQILDLINLNPFRYYRNWDATLDVAAGYFNVDNNFFDATIDFQQFAQKRSRNGANNKSGYNGNIHIQNNIRQSDFNVYLAFALVIQNPENSNQYIVGPLSNIVKQSLVMGINSTSKKVPKGFAYRV
jgi:hypothetical protein